MKLNIIIGAGGVGSWLVPSLCMLKGKENILVVDGDKLERKNLNRQLFTEADIGRNKADALAEKYGCRSHPEFYSDSLFEVERSDCLLVCVDNNPGRRAALATADSKECCVIFGANEVTSSEAYYYDPKWKGTPHDPRVYYPEIETDSRFDPRMAGIGCTGEAQVRNRQLVTSNYMASALMQHLFVLWRIEKITGDAVQHVPYRIRQNMTKFEITTLNK